MTSAVTDFATIVGRQQRLRLAVAKLADQIAAGRPRTSNVELAALAELCREQFLPTEAARVRRWMRP